MAETRMLLTYANPSKCFTRVSSESWLGSYGLSLLGISNTAGTGCKPGQRRLFSKLVIHVPHTCSQSQQHWQAVPNSCSWPDTVQRMADAPDHGSMLSESGFTSELKSMQGCCSYFSAVEWTGSLHLVQTIRFQLHIEASRLTQDHLSVVGNYVAYHVGYRL